LGLQSVVEKICIEPPVWHVNSSVIIIVYLKGGELKKNFKLNFFSFFKRKLKNNKLKKLL